MPGFKLPPMMFTDEEAQALVAGTPGCARARACRYRAGDRKRGGEACAGHAGSAAREQRGAARDDRVAGSGRRRNRRATAARAQSRGPGAPFGGRFAIARRTAARRCVDSTSTAWCFAAAAGTSSGIASSATGCGRCGWTAWRRCSRRRGRSSGRATSIRRVSVRGDAQSSARVCLRGPPHGRPRARSRALLLDARHAGRGAGRSAPARIDRRSRVDGAPASRAALRRRRRRDRRRSSAALATLVAKLALRHTGRRRAAPRRNLQAHAVAEASEIVQQALQAPGMALLHIADELEDLAPRGARCVLERHRNFRGRVGDVFRENTAADDRERKRSH